MKKILFGLAAAFTLACGASAPAGTLQPQLQAIVASTSIQTDIPVIVRFRDQVDVKAVRREASRIARAMYPDDAKKRKKTRRKLIRKMLVEALKDTAKDSKKAVKAFLKANGENRKLKLLWARNSVVADIPVHLLGDLADQPYVDRIVLDATIQAPGTGTAPTAPNLWNLDATGVQTLWAMGNTGQDVVVATLDTGVDASHPDLAPRWRGGNNSWFDPYDQHNTPADNNGHGTQVLGLIVGGAAGGYQVGMAPDAQWIAAKIFDDSDEATLSGIHEAFQWVLDPDGNSNTDDAPHLVNNSWDLSNTVNQCVQEFAPDIALLKAADIAVVFAGGNYGPDADSSVSPANDPAVLSVGAVNSGFTVETLSSRGANACNGGIYPSLVAPGDSVLTTDRMPGFYNIVSGTSFAVAHLAGGMAVLKSAFPDASVTEIEASVIDTAGDLGAADPDDGYGHGLMDVAAAYAALEAELGDGNPGSLQFGTGYSVDENVATLTVTVTRSGGSSGEVSVDYATADRSASAGADYQSASGTLVFLDGEASRTFDVTILDDGSDEADETFDLILSNPQGGATLGVPDSVVATILDDDLPSDADGDGVSDALDQCSDTPAGETADANGCSPSQRDTDDDGISDALDQCPGTATGETVDANGCAASQFDSDNDGITDDLDQCPATSVSETADANGCSASQRDTDNDGITDDLDQCPTTPVSETADANGCSASQRDSDSDSVTDDLDQCPATPVSETADANGCSASQRDSDNDGVTDDLDQCPDTPANETADANGCSASQQSTGGAKRLYFSTIGAGSSNPVPDVTGVYDDADIYANDGNSYSRIVDAVNLGLPGNADVDGLHVVDADTFYLSFNRDGGTAIPGLGTVQDEDVVLYDAGSWSLFFDGSVACRLDAGNGQDVDAIHVEGGVLYFSTLGGGNSTPVAGVVAPYDDADIYTWSQGATSCGRSFDASQNGLPRTADIDGLTLTGGTTYMSFNRGGTIVPSLGTVQDEAVISYDGETWSLYFGAPGLSTTNGQDIDAIHVP